MHSKKHNYVYYSLLGIALAVVYFIQSATPLLPAFFGVRPLPAFVLMLCVAAFGGETAGIISGLSLGIAMDIGATSPDGFNALTLMLMGLACSLLSTYLFNRRIPAAAVLCGIFCTLYYLLNWLVSVVAKGYLGAFEYLWRYSLTGAIYTWLFVFLFWPLVSLFTKKSLKPKKTNSSLLE